MEFFFFSPFFLPVGVVNISFHFFFLTAAEEKKKGERNRERAAPSLVFAMSGYTSTWVQCDNPGCLKWRRISRAAAEALGEQQW